MAAISVCIFVFVVIVLSLPVITVSVVPCRRQTVISDVVDINGYHKWAC